MEIALTIFLILVVMLFIYGPSVIAILKRHYILGTIGLLLFPPVGWIGALLLAKPESWWARTRYDDQKVARAIAKHGDPATRSQPATPPAPGAPAATVAAAGAAAIPDAGDDGEGDWACGICGETSATRVAAESHVRGAHPQAPVESSVSQVPAG